MRIPQPYGQRSSVGISEAKIKYFLAFEGRRTEYRYFRGIHINRNEVGIDSLVEIIPIEHDSKNMIVKPAVIRSTCIMKPKKL